jgi:hypothetical protein
VRVFAAPQVRDCPLSGAAASVPYMPTTRGTAVVACAEGTAEDSSEDPFFRRQFEEARTAAAAAAQRLAFACASNAARPDLDRLAQRVSAAVSELRIAIQAARLSPTRDHSPPRARVIPLLLAVTSALHMAGG